MQNGNKCYGENKPMERSRKFRVGCKERWFLILNTVIRKGSNEKYRTEGEESVSIKNICNVSSKRSGR